MRKICVLDYSTSSVDIITPPDSLSEETKEVEKWLQEERGYRLDDIYWMDGVSEVNFD